jgi:iron complex outermembrane receptor protein
VTGQTVDVTRISGGNANLRAEERNVLKFGVNFRPEKIQGLTLNANYTRTRIDNPVAGFPAATAAVEAAFPDRFARDADGNLTRIDSRPVNFAKRESEQIRWGLNFSRQIGKTPPRRPVAGAVAKGAARVWAANARDGSTVPGADLLRRTPGGAAGDSAPARAPQPDDQNQQQQTQPAQTGEEPPRPNFGDRSSGGGDGGQRFGGGGAGGAGGRGGGGGFGGRGGGGGNPRATRLQLALFHTVHLRERVTIADGIPALDLLKGDVLGSGGGEPRHEVEAQAGITRYGLGAASRPTGRAPPTSAPVWAGRPPIWTSRTWRR